MVNSIQKMFNAFQLIGKKEIRETQLLSSERSW